MGFVSLICSLTIGYLDRILLLVYIADPKCASDKMTGENKLSAAANGVSYKNPTIITHTMFCPLHLDSL